MPAAPDTTPAPAHPARLLEMVLVMVFGYCCHLYYNPVGYLTSLQGRDLGPLVMTPLDKWIGFQPFWVLFYQLAYFAPLVALLLVVLTGKARLPQVRRALAAFVSLLAAHYTIYLALPVSARILRRDPTTLGDGLLERLVAYQYLIATPWNALPSLHVSACWYFYRLLAEHLPRAGRPYLLWFGAMVVSTTTIKIHFVADGLAGLLMGEAAYRLFVRLRQRQKLEGRWPSAPVMIAAYATAIALALGGLILLVTVAGYDGPLYVVLGRTP